MVSRRNHPLKLKPGNLLRVVTLEYVLKSSKFWFCIKLIQVGKTRKQYNACMVCMPSKYVSSEVRYGDAMRLRWVSVAAVCGHLCWSETNCLDDSLLLYIRDSAACPLIITLTRGYGKAARMILRETFSCRRTGEVQRRVSNGWSRSQLYNSKSFIKLYKMCV